MTRKNQAHAFWAGVSATSPGRLNESVACSRPRQPSQLKRPNAAKSRPIPPRSAISETTLQRTVWPVGPLSTSASGGQLFVYEYSWPGRSAAAAHADQAKNAVSWWILSGSVIASGTQAVLRVRLAQLLGVVLAELFEGERLALGQLERVRSLRRSGSCGSRRWSGRGDRLCPADSFSSSTISAERRR